jgi:hypothetical protein
VECNLSRVSIIAAHTQPGRSGSGHGRGILVEQVSLENMSIDQIGTEADEGLNYCKTSKGPVRKSTKTHGSSATHYTQEKVRA